MSCIISVSCHLFGRVVLTETCCGTFGQLLQLGDTVVIAAEVARESCFGIWTNRPSLVDAVITTYLLLVSLQYLLWVENLECVLEQIDLTFVICGCVSSHRR